MKTYINIKLPFKRKFKIQKDKIGSYYIGLIKEDPLPRIGRKALEELDNNLCNDPEKVRELIEPRYYRGQYNADDITVTAINNMIKAAATTPAKDISELLYTEKSMSEEEKEYYRGLIKKAEKEIEAGKKELERINK
jgi:hypothetical protein